MTIKTSDSAANTESLMAVILRGTWFCPICDHPNDTENECCHACGKPRDVEQA